MLLWTGHLPSKEEAEGIQKDLAAYRALRPETLEIIKTARNAPPIDALRMACATLSLDVSNPNVTSVQLRSLSIVFGQPIVFRP